MKRKLTGLSREYTAALRKHLKQGPQASLQPARALGRQAVAGALETLDVAKIHDGALAALEASSSKDGIIKRAEIFFAEAITPIEKTHGAALKANAHLNQLNKTLDRRTVDLAASNRFLKQDIVQRKGVEQALKKSAGRYARLVTESHRLEKHLRHLTHQLLSMQEKRRTKISRKLHNEIAQTLLGINVRLLTLKKEATVNTKDFKKEIASTQRLVEKSVKTMSRFGHEFDKHNDT
jgi:signal transduction histidine kinase